MSATTPAHVGVLGGGRMGAGIAHAFLISGSRVTVVERDQASADSARERVEKNVAVSVARGLDADLATLNANLTVATEHAAFADCSLVIEAVPEHLTLKLEALAATEAHLVDSATLASNTSSIPLAQLAARLARPAQFIGLHFFNPVPASSLVEIVIADATAPALAEQARTWVAALGKTPITVKDSPGFASSRLGVALALEAIRMVESGVASAADIDTAMELGYRHPTGPLKTTDIVGLDVRLGIAEQLQAAFGDSFAPPQLMRDMVARGELGRKTGKGFYDYSDDAAK
ncbi:3-hydroxyacyl-CoA dehydrogenase family protein [Micrococcales bacterium 31B]|nr:3-hydroxyacyl-CoA dehydrogenase family protein [Micrococcales bacterium 31B]